MNVTPEIGVEQIQPHGVQPFPHSFALSAAHAEEASGHVVSSLWGGPWGKEASQQPAKSRGPQINNL